MQGSTWKDSSESDLRADGSRNRIPYENIAIKHTEKYELLRKSKRVPKKRSLDGVFDDRNGDDDEEIRYLEKVKKSKVNTNYGAQFDNDEGGGSRKQRKISRVLKKNVDVLYEVNVGEYGSSKLGKEAKKSKSGRAAEDVDYLEEEEPVSDVEPEIKKKKARKEFVELLGDSKKELTVTTRQRALQTGKDVTSSVGASLLEFPNGLPPVPPRSE